MENQHISANEIKLGVDEFFGADAKDMTVVDAISGLALGTIASVKNVTGDTYLTPVLTEASEENEHQTSVSLTLNVAKVAEDITDTNSALSVKNGKITIE